VNQADAAIARLRLFLADIEGKEKQLQTMRRQFRDQMERVIGFALYREASVDQTLSMLTDVDEREQAVELTLQHLVRLRDRVRAEIESLELTRGIEAAKLELADLESRKARLEAGATAMESSAGGSEANESPSLEELRAEIRRLQALIHEASDRAIRSLTARSPLERSRRGV